MFQGRNNAVLWWNPEVGCVRKKDLAKEASSRVIGIPSYLWTFQSFKSLGDARDGFLEIDRETMLRTEVS